MVWGAKCTYAVRLHGDMQVNIAILGLVCIVRAANYIVPATRPSILVLLTQVPLLAAAARQITVLSLLLFVYFESQDLGWLQGGCTMCSVGVKPQLRPSCFKGRCHPQSVSHTSQAPVQSKPQVISGPRCFSVISFSCYSSFISRQKRCSWLTPAEDPIIIRP